MGFRSGHAPAQQPEGFFPVDARINREYTITQHIRLGPAAVSGGGVVYIDIAPVKPDDLTALHHTVQRAPVAFFAPPQRLIGLPALRDIP